MALTDETRPTCWDAYLSRDIRCFDKEVKATNKDEPELIRLIDFAIRDAHIWAIEIYEKYHNNPIWLSQAFDKAATCGALTSLKHLEKNSLYDSFIGELAISRAAQFRRIGVLKYLLDNYRLRSPKDLFTYGLYFTCPTTQATILQHPKVEKYIYEPYRHANSSYEGVVRGVLEREKKRRRDRHERLLLLYVFLVSWAREVKSRPGNSDYLAAMAHFYMMARGSTTNLETSDSQYHSQIATN